MPNSTETYAWAVIGAGPAGIAAIGKLIDSGIAPETITWIDPDFNVGDFGSKWFSVPSNTKVKLFLEFLAACKSFNYQNCSENFALHRLDPEETCELFYMVQPLQWATTQLRKMTTSIPGVVKQLALKQRLWHITLNDGMLLAKNVVLAIGAEPKSLALSGQTAVPLEVALNRGLLSQHITSDDTVAVFGASHSAILIIRNLLESTKVKKVLNFYQTPLRYAITLDEEILFDDTGLKGTTADWARENIDGKLPEKLFRVLSTPENTLEKLPDCTKAIYAVGFQRRTIPIDGIKDITYNDRSGIIAPGLFGLGIAFPEAKTDRFGTVEYRVGLWKFMEYLTRVMPVWLRYHT